MGSILQTAAVDYTMLVIARLIGGIAIGMLSMVSPLFIAEVSPPEIRGALLVLEELSIVSGIVIAYWITYGTQHMRSEWAWRMPFLLQLVPVRDRTMTSSNVRPQGFRTILLLALFSSLACSLIRYVGSNADLVFCRVLSWALAFFSSRSLHGG